RREVPMQVEAEVVHIAPVRKAITVKRSVADTFEIFTARIGRWWPLLTHSISEQRAVDVVIEPRVGGELCEVRDDGERFPWGRVLAWEPPGRLVVTWHPGQDPAAATELEVRFSPVEGGTRVELEHRGWVKLGARAREVREGYDRGWESVFGKSFAEACR
ncbi:MAG: SRPBCC domain-containing protein, partial [Thermoanaerobaculia bacterium]